VLANDLINIHNCLRVSEGGLDTIRDDLGHRNPNAFAVLRRTSVCVKLRLPTCGSI
jgi:hypothetical protein